MVLDRQKLYKLPWSAYNNPHSWIEPTTFCQLACPGCFRGLALPNPIRIHQDLNNVKKEINKLIKIRKIKSISIAGGEPLTYPNLIDVITYGKKWGLRIYLVTNGVALTKEKLLTLKKAGLDEAVIHVGIYQKRPDNPEQNSTLALRDRFCRMFREINGVNLGFITTITDDNFKDLPQILNYYQKNSDIISHTYLTLYRDVLFFDSNKIEDTNITLEDITSLVNKKYKIDPCAYLGKTIDPEGISWLFYIAIFHGDKIIGFIDNSLFEKLHQLYFKQGKYQFPVIGTKINAAKSAVSIFHPSALKILKNYLVSMALNPSQITKPLRFQMINIINTPKLTKQGWDFCDGCPDAMLYNNRLVPSCLLERVKRGEDIRN